MRVKILLTSRGRGNSTTRDVPLVCRNLRKVRLGGQNCAGLRSLAEGESPRLRIAFNYEGARAQEKALARAKRKNCILLAIYLPYVSIMPLV